MPLKLNPFQTKHQRRSLSLAICLLFGLAHHAPVTAGDYTVSDGVSRTPNGGWGQDPNNDLQSGDSLTVTETGTIEFAGAGGDYAIDNDESGGTSVSILGRVRTTNGGGIHLEGNGNTVIVTGSGAVVADVKEAIGLVGDNNIVEVSSTAEPQAIGTTGDDAYGIYNRGNSNTTTASGSISTSGADAYSIYNRGNSNTTTVSGSISTSGADAYGIYNPGDSNTTTVSGSISTSGADAHGIFNFSNSNSNTTTVTGLITTWSDGSHGILNVGDSNTTTVSGSVNTWGEEALGICSEGNYNNINLSGSIATNRSFATGVETYGNDNSINISGRIDTRGDDADGIYSDGDRNTVSISGSVLSLGGKAVYVSGDNNTVNIQRGARIVGTISLDTGTGNRLRFNIGPAKSYIFATEGDWTLEDLDGRTVVAGSAMAAGIGNLETADEMQYGRLDRLNSALSRSNKLDASQAQSWAVPYVSTGKRKADALTPAVTHYDTKSMGVVAGKPTDWWGGKADLLLQLDHNKLNIAGNDHVITSTSARMGLRVSDTDLSTQSSQSVIAMVGYNHYDSARSVLMNENTTTGETTFNAKFGSLEFLLGGVASTAYQLTPKMKLKTDAQVDVSYEMIDSYTESTYFSWKKRNLLQASARVAATVERQHQHNLHSLWGLAISHRNVLKGREGDYAINGTSVSFKGGDHKDTVATLSAGIKYNFKKDMTLRADVSTSISANRVSNHNANIKLDWKF